MTFNLSMLSDPRVVAVNKVAPHSDHRWFASLTEQKAKESSYEQSLDGIWKFQYARNPNLAPEGFEDLAYDTSTWDDIRVPAHIQMEGYDRPQYVNTQYPWDGHEEILPPEIPMDFNPTASYVKDFQLDRQLEPGELVTVTFEGAESALAVWLNGKFIGYAEDSFTPSEFDLTDALVDGKNKLAAQVFKSCSGSWLEDQDFFRFSGLSAASFCARTQWPTCATSGSVLIYQSTCLPQLSKLTRNWTAKGQSPPRLTDKKWTR